MIEDKVNSCFSDSTKKLSEIDIIKMLKFLSDNIFTLFGGRVFTNKEAAETRGHSGLVEVIT